MIKRLAFFFTLFCTLSFAQTTTFTANLKDLATNTPATPEAGPVYLELTLKNCAGSGTNPTIPHVNGVGALTFPVNLYPIAGAISTPVYDETVIVCGSSTGVSYYHVRMYQGDNTRSLIKKLLFEDDFDVQGASFNLNSATPRSGSVITPPPATAVLTNPAGNQTIVQPVGTSLSINRLSATFAQNSNGADMISGNRFTDTSPTGNFLRFRNAANNADLWTVDVSGILQAGTIPAARVSALFYQTFQNAASGLTQRGTVNFFAGISCSDNAGATRTDCRLGTLTTVSFSATPTFDASTASTFKITLTGNVTSSTLSNAVAGQPLTFIVCQDGTGGRTFVPPTNVQGWLPISSTLSTCSTQVFAYDGTNAQPDLLAGLTGDVTSNPGSTATTVAKVNGVSFPSSPSTHAVPVVTAANAATWKVVPDCTDTTGNHLNFTQSTDVWSCGTSVPANTVTTTGSQTLTNKTLTGTGSGNRATLLDSQDVLGNITGDGTDKTVYTFTIPANTIQAGKGIRFRFHALNNNAVVVTYKFKLGTTTFLTAPTSAASNNNGFQFEIFNNAGVQNAQRVIGFGFDGLAIMANTTVTAAENTANALALTVTASEANPNTITPAKWIVELIQ